MFEWKRKNRTSRCRDILYGTLTQGCSLLVGISIEGDEELLAIPKEAPKRDEWMTTLPPERKVISQSTRLLVSFHLTQPQE